MQVQHLNCGTMCPRPAALIHGHGGIGPARLVCHCLLVELRDGWALIDTGLGTRDVLQGRARLGGVFVNVVAPTLSLEECAVTQLQRFGLSARDVRYVLPTHLDLDHAGGITDFPEATVHLLAREHIAASARSGRFGGDRYKPAQWRDARFELHEATGERWFGFEGVRPLAGSQDELLIIPLPGHTHGHAGIAVRTGERWLLHAGDAYFSHREQLGKLAPIGLEVFQSALEVDRRQRLHNRARLAELVRTHSDEVTVFCAHDPDELTALAAT